MKIAVVVFDFDWNYLGNVVYERPEDQFPKDPFGWDTISREAAKKVAPQVKDFHIGIARIDGDGEFEVTPEMIDALKEEHRLQRLNFTTMWENEEGAVTSFKPGSVKEVEIESENH